MTTEYVDRWAESLQYAKGFKYQCMKDAQVYVGDLGQTFDIDLDWLSLTVTGVLTIKKGYACDGPSGPTWDTPNLMRAAFAHDALYELIRKRLLPPSARLAADTMYYEQLIVDGTWIARAKWHYWGVSNKGEDSTLPSNQRKILYAP